MTVATNLAGVTVEIGFGVNAVGGPYFVLDDPVKGKLDDVTYLLAPDTVFVDVTADVASVSIKRGRERELDEYATGTASVVFNDNDRTFDPSYSGSPYAGQITPMRRINIRSGGNYLFAGWVDDWEVVYEPGDKLSRVTADCVDAFAILANQQLAEIAPSFSGDLSGVRITRVLDRAEVAFPAARAIDAGNTTLGATTLGANALSYLQQCARAEAGFLFVSAEGTLTFRNRLAVLNVMASAVFSDNRAAGVPYMMITQRSASDLLYTRVTGESETTSNEKTAVAPTATTDNFLIRTLALGTLFTLDDTQTQSIVDYYLGRFSTIEVRFHQATVNMAAASAVEVAAVTSLDLSDVVTVARSPMGVGAMISRLSIIDGISHRIGHGKWLMDLAFANADTRAFLTLDDAVLGVLDSYRLAF